MFHLLLEFIFTDLFNILNFSFFFYHFVGTIGDIDNDGILDIIYITDYFIPLTSTQLAKAESMGNANVNGPVTASLFFLLTKKSLDSSIQVSISLDPEKTYIDENVRSEKLKDGCEGYDFKLDLTRSKWMGYCGADGDCIFE